VYTPEGVLAVLSLDSVAAPLVERLLAEGCLPNLAEIQRRGRAVELAEELPGAAYATLYTGRRLADHGLYFPLQWSATHQAARPYQELMSAELERHSLFRRLAAHGLRVLVLDPPECVPHAVDRGVLASGVQFRARVLLPEWSRPKGVGRSLAAAAGRSPRADEIFGQPSVRYLLHMRRHLLDAPGRLASAAERLLQEETFDLVWITFTAAHQAGHVLFEPALVKERLSGEEERVLRSALADVYARVDEALGRILARLPAGADVLVLSPKGMGANAARVDLLSGMLDRILGQGSDEATLRPSPVWLLRSCLPLSIRALVAAALGDRLAYALAGRLETLGRDWRRTRAFALPCDNHGFVRFNLEGRERRGSASPQRTRELTEEIVLGLLSFEDMGGETEGAPSVARVETAAERVGSGARVEQLPDLFVHWSRSPSARIRGVRSPRFGEVLRRGVGSGRAGNHCPGNWVTLLPGRARVAPSIPEPACLEDIVATVCSALGVPHADLPGRPLFVRS
jgi:predicted AlkP superfamily phosphohydrolase/phosphomutase